MLTLSEAKDVLIDHLASRGGPQQIDWVATETIERPWGWGMHYAPRLWVETGDILHAPAGNWPMIVDGRDGSVLPTTPHEQLEDELDRYEAGEWDPRALSWARFEAHRRFGRPDQAAQELVDLVLNSDPGFYLGEHEAVLVQERRRLEQACLQSLDDGAPLGGVEATCLGHMARLHGALLRRDAVVQLLIELRTDPTVGGACEDALDDLRIYASTEPTSSTTWRSAVVERGSAADFLVDENWHGGYYELAIDLGKRSAADADGRLTNALRAVWSDDRLDGCYLDRWASQAGQRRVSPFLTDDGQGHVLYGTACIPAEHVIVCATHVVREEFGEELHDWLTLGLPTGALGRVDQRIGGYPFEEEDDSLAWRRAIDEWFAQIAQRVLEVAPFRVALIGFEVSGDPAAEAFEAGVPDERRLGYLIPGAWGVDFLAATR